MTAHRFQDQLRSFQPANREAFVPCPMFQAFSGCQQAQIQEVYRLAAELTREQLRPTIAYPAYSMN